MVLISEQPAQIKEKKYPQTFSIAPKPTVEKKEQKVKQSKKHEKYTRPEALGISQLKEVAIRAPIEVQEKYGKGVASLTFGEENINVTSFDSGILVIPETQSVVFTKHARNPNQTRSLHAFLAKPWSTWVNENEREDSSAVNIKLSPKLVTEDLVQAFEEKQPSVATEDLTIGAFKKNPEVFSEEEKLPSWVRGLVAARLATGNTGISGFETEAGTRVEVSWDFPKDVKDVSPKTFSKKDDGTLDFDRLEEAYGKKTLRSEIRGKYKLLDKASDEEIKIKDLNDNDIRFLYKKIFGRDYSYIPKVPKKGWKDAEIEHLTGRRKPVFGDPSGKNFQGVEVLAPQASNQNIQIAAKSERTYVEITENKPDIEGVVIDPEEPLGNQILMATDSINRTLPKWAKMKKRVPELRDVLFDGKNPRLKPVIINPDIMLFENPRMKSTILVVATKKGWTSRYFKHDDGNVAGQIDGWLKPDRVSR